MKKHDPSPKSNTAAAAPTPIPALAPVDGPEAGVGVDVADVADVDAGFVVVIVAVGADVVVAASIVNDSLLPMYTYGGPTAVWLCNMRRYSDSADLKFDGIVQFHDICVAQLPLNPVSFQFSVPYLKA